MRDFMDTLRSSGIDTGAFYFKFTQHTGIYESIGQVFGSTWRRNKVTLIQISTF